MADYLIYGAKGSGSVAVEAALTLAGEAYEVVERAPFSSAADAEAIGRLNPMRQVPAGGLEFLTSDFRPGFSVKAAEG